MFAVKASIANRYSQLLTILVRMMRDKMAALANGSQFPAAQTVRDRIEENEENVPEEFLNLIIKTATKKQMELFTAELMTSLDRAFREIYMPNRTDLVDDFGRPTDTNRYKWQQLFKTYELICQTYVDENPRSTPRGFLGKFLVLYKWSTDSEFPPFPMLTETVVLAVSIKLGKIPLALTEVSG